MWGRFFDSIGNEDTESYISGSHGMPEFGSMRSLSQIQQSPHSEVHPNDSASVMDDAPSQISGYNRHGAAAPPPELPVDDGTYVFKFRTPSGRTHRFQSRHDDVEHLREIVMGKLATDPFFTEYRPEDGGPRPDPIDFVLSYTDADGDTVLITSDHDVAEAVKIARETGEDSVVLFVQGGKGWERAAPAAEAKAAEVAEAAHKAKSEVEYSEKVAAEAPPHHTPAHRGKYDDVDEVMGIPRDLLLPASIGALAVVIVGIFTISRLTQPSY